MIVVHARPVPRLCKKRTRNAAQNHVCGCKVDSYSSEDFPSYSKVNQVDLTTCLHRHPLNHATHLIGPYPSPAPSHRGNINSQPPQSSLRTRPRSSHTGDQTMVLSTPSSTTLETRSYFSIEVQPIRSTSYGYPDIRLSALSVDQEGIGLVCGRIFAGSKGRAEELGDFGSTVCWYVLPDLRL
jgi:hypothetical protein